MSAVSVLRDLAWNNIHPQPTADGTQLLIPIKRITAAQRERLVQHKAEILEILSDTTAQQLMAAAMRCCDHYGDSSEARMQMRLDIWNTPPRLRAELLAHFQQEYPCSD